MPNPPQARERVDVEGLREKVARAIDPTSWRWFDKHPPFAPLVPRETQISWHIPLQASLAAADAILALPEIASLIDAPASQIVCTTSTSRGSR